jgi:hypothetical protein
VGNLIASIDDHGKGHADIQEERDADAHDVVNRAATMHTASCAERRGGSARAATGVWKVYARGEAFTLRLEEQMDDGRLKHGHKDQAHLPQVEI